MSRRSQAHRRRTYGRRQHDIRERRPTEVSEAHPWARTDDWTAPDLAGERRPADEDSYGSFAR